MGVPRYRAWLLCVLGLSCRAREAAPEPSREPAQPTAEASSTATPQRSAPPAESPSEVSQPAGGDAHAEATPATGALDLGRLLGRRTDARLPAAGRYAGALHASQRRFITRERTSGRRIEAGLVVELQEDGRASGCGWADTTDRGSTSKYASRDGKAHSTESETSLRIGLDGSWVPAPAGDAALITFDRLSNATCDLKSPYVAPSPVTLTCYGLSADSALPVDGIACRLETSHSTLELAGLLLAGTDRDGAWDLHRDLGRGPRSPRPEGAKPWIILGSEPGLMVTHNDRRRTDGITLNLGATVVAAPSD